MTMERCRGLSDKLYWRQVAGGRFHCFKKMKLVAEEVGTVTCTATGQTRTILAPKPRVGFFPLCDARYELKKTGGGQCQRPEPILRCARCDLLEMKRRGWEESGPTLAPRLPASWGKLEEAAKKLRAAISHDARCTCSYCLSKCSACPHLMRTHGPRGCRASRSCGPSGTFPCGCKIVPAPEQRRVRSRASRPGEGSNPGKKGT